MANHVLQFDHVDDVLVVPANVSPFKADAGASAAHRWHMLVLAFASCDRCRVDDIELQRSPPSYMVETLEMLQVRGEDRELFLIIGADNVADFHHWHRASDIVELAQILVLGRDGLTALPPPQWSHRFHFLPGFDEQVSSSRIRAMLAAGEASNRFLDPSVINYITEHGLYL